MTKLTCHTGGNPSPLPLRKRPRRYHNDLAPRPVFSKNGTTLYHIAYRVWQCQQI